MCPYTLWAMSGIEWIALGLGTAVMAILVVTVWKFLPRRAVCLV